MWCILNAENKILKYVQILAARKKIRRIEKSLLLLKIRRIWEILAFAKNQADLRNPCVYRKSNRFEKSLRLQKIRRTIESSRALKSPCLVKNQRLKKNPRLKKNRQDWKSRRPAYCLGSAESPAADFFLVWMMSSRSDPFRCDESRMQSPNEEKAQAALLLWAALSRTVPAVCTGPPCQEMAQIHAATKNQVSAWNSTNSCQITKFLTRLLSVLSLSRKNVHDHSCCPISAVILTTSKLEAILKILRGSWKTAQESRIIGGGGGSPTGTSQHLRGLWERR
jgi:hypothetical protein